MSRQGNTGLFLAEQRARLRVSLLLLRQELALLDKLRRHLLNVVLRAFQAAVEREAHALYYLQMLQHFIAVGLAGGGISFCHVELSEHAFGLFPHQLRLALKGILDCLKSLQFVLSLL